MEYHEPNPIGLQVLEELRQPLRHYALDMEAKLKVTDYKGGWEKAPLSWLLMRLKQEVEELDHAISYESPEAASKESADVGNLSMMIHDRIRRRNLGGYPLYPGGYPL